jgi:asparagine synthetase B (glutamine-hydrolysing)
MAAIAGIISTNREQLKQVTSQVQNMIQQMRHRGPDKLIIREIPDSTAAFGAAEINLMPTKTRCTSMNTKPYILFDGELINVRDNR